MVQCTMAKTIRFWMGHCQDLLARMENWTIYKNGKTVRDIIQFAMSLSGAKQKNYFYNDECTMLGLLGNIEMNLSFYRNECLKPIETSY